MRYTAHRRPRCWLLAAAPPPRTSAPRRPRRRPSPTPRTSPIRSARAATPSPPRPSSRPCPSATAGTTAGYIDDYDEVCPYTGATAPDVVYQYTAAACCRDRHHRPLRLRLRHQALRLRRRSEPDRLQRRLLLRRAVRRLRLEAGERAGRRRARPTTSSSTATATASGSLPAHRRPAGLLLLLLPADRATPRANRRSSTDYVDTYNGGCNTPRTTRSRRSLGDTAGEAFFSGASGWYLSAGTNFRDTDWFILTDGCARAAIEVTL